MSVDCEGCGETFDPDRESAVPGASTSRCPSCGREHDRDDSRASTGTVTVDAPDGLSVEVHVHLNTDG